MTDISLAPSKIIPNTFQTPNLLTDEGLLALLNGSETKCYLVVIRKTFGWRKDRDRIAKSQIMAATGLSEKAVDQSMASLVAFGLILRTAENNQANEGVEWAPQMDDSQINMQALVERQEKAKQANAQKTAKARSKRGGGVVQHPPHVQQPPPGVVQQSPQQPITTSSSGSSSGTVFKKYEEEFGALTPMIANAIEDACKTYSAEWVPEAMEIAVKANKRNWKYVEGILKICKAKNIRPSLSAKEKSNGNNGTGNQKSTGKTEYTPDDHAAAERVKKRRAAVPAV